MFLKTVEAKVIILTSYVKPNETLAIKKFVFCLSTFSNICETTGPIELKFHMATPKGVGRKVWSHDQDGRHAHIW